MAVLSETALFQQIRHPQKRAFLLAYSECGRMPLASSSAKIHRSLPYHWLKADGAFASAFAEAQELAVQALEDEAVRRAKDGVKRTIFYQGVPIGEETEYSDTLLIFLLKGAKPEQYRERHEHTGAKGGAIVLKVVYEGESEA